MRRMLHALISRDFTLCDCVDMWCFPTTHWILTEWQLNDWLRSPVRVECAAIDQVIKKASHVCISESSSWRCVFIEFWSWVIFTSCPGSKESSTGLTGECTNAFNNRVYIEETDQLTDFKMFYLLLAFCRGGHSKMLPAETLLLLHVMMLCPPSFSLRSSGKIYESMQ